jgi:hypothetical protein
LVASRVPFQRKPKKIQNSSTGSFAPLANDRQTNKDKDK